MFCKQCGKPIDDGEELCEDCKGRTNSNQAQNQTQGNYNSNGANGQTYNNAGNTNASGYSNAQNGQSYNNGGQTYNTNTSSAPKSKIAAGLLGIFLGSFGVHNFYLGYTGKAIAQLLITVLTCGVGAFISGIWGLIEGILILTGSMNTDAKGNPLTD